MKYLKCKFNGEDRTQERVAGKIKKSKNIWKSHTETSYFYELNVYNGLIGFILCILSGSC